MMKKNAPAVALVIGGPKRPDSEEEDMDEGDEMPVADEAKASAVKDLFAAYKKNDVSAGVAAMDAFLEACGYGKSNQMESESESESAK